MSWAVRARLGLALIAAAPLGAQQTVNWDRLATWDDSLEQVTDPSQLGDWRALAAAPGGEMATLRTTLWRLREAALRVDRGALAVAADNALVDRNRYPHIAMLDMALARTFLAFEVGRGAPLIGSGVREGEAYLDAAWRYLREGMQRDANLPSLRALAVHTLVVSGDRIIQDNAVTTLRILLRDRYPHPDILLAAARYQRQQLHHDSALTYLGRAGLAGGDPAVLALERAWTLMALGDSTAAEQAYWFGLERLTPAGRDLYRYDLEWFLDADSLAVFDAVPLADAGVWLRRFWRGRDAEAVNPIGARLLEQLRRRAYVLEHFRVTVPWRRTHFERVEYRFDPPRICTLAPPDKMYDRLGKQPTFAGDPRRRELLLDHRGVVYLRHGEPIERIGRVQADADEVIIARNESWLYLLTGFQRLLHFHGSQAVGTHTATTLRASLPANPQLYISRGNYLGIYAEAAMSLLPENRTVDNPECETAVLAAVDQSRQDVTLALRSDSDAPPLTTPWPATMKLHQVGDVAAGTSRVLLTYAVPTDFVERETARDGRAAFPIRLRIVGYDESTLRYIQIDTLQRIIMPAGYQGNWIGGWLELPFPVGHWLASALISQPRTSGSGPDTLGGATVRRPDLVVDGTPPLRVTDLVGGIAQGPSWRAPDGQDFPLNPMQVWAPKQPMQLYYEIHGLAADARFRTSVQILDGTGTARINVGTVADASGPVMAVRRVLDIAELREGSYTLRIRIESDGHSVERQLHFVVKE